MNYLICQDWINTGNNHAGIKYLCNKLQELYPTQFVSIAIPDFTHTDSNYRFVKSLNFRCAKLRHWIYRHELVKQLLKKIHSKDKIFLMEYMEKSASVLDVAQQIKLYNPHIPIYGLVHLVPDKLDKNFPQEQQLNQWIEAVDKILTLGHSLTDYFLSKGVKQHKLHTSFHYVDNYYHNPNPQRNNEKIKVIAMGNQMRNIALLEQIVIANPNVNFIICQGISDMSSTFGDKKNVELMPFITENELRQKMKEADISLNVMTDTIGSNVIVTSLAMGLAMVCSDVGSIRDYCDDTNTIFCDNNEVSQFTRAIALISMEKERLAAMQQSAAKSGKLLTIEKFAQELIEL